MSAMTKKEWMAYIEKTWDAAQKEAWSEPQFECPRCGHCCQAKLETEQEPVAWLKTWSDGSVSVLKTKSHAFADHELEPLYTAPPKRTWVGLTDEEINSVRHNRDWTAFWTDTTFARAIEAKLKERNT